MFKLSTTVKQVEMELRLTVCPCCMLSIFIFCLFYLELFDLLSLPGFPWKIYFETIFDYSLKEKEKNKQ